MTQDRSAAIASGRAWVPLPTWKCGRLHEDAEPRIVPVGEECPACGYDEEGQDHDR